MRSSLLYFLMKLATSALTPAPPFFSQFAIKPLPFCPIFPSIFRQKPLSFVVQPLYFPFKPQFCIIITDSTCLVPANISTPHPSTAPYPNFFITLKSLPNVSGLHDTYTTFFTPIRATDSINASVLPLLGGSMITRSTLSPLSAISTRNFPASLQ